jgi:hypothetical protein
VIEIITGFGLYLPVRGGYWLDVPLGWLGLFYIDEVSI